jgi:hypothetical protein
MEVANSLVDSNNLNSSDYLSLDGIRHPQQNISRLGDAQNATQYSKRCKSQRKSRH